MCKRAGKLFDCEGKQFTGIFKTEGDTRRDCWLDGYMFESIFRYSRKRGLNRV